MPHHKDPLDLLLDAIFDQIFDAEWTGRHGEKLTAKQLKRLAFFMGEGKVLRNVYVPKEGGGTSEIDVLFITSRGVFVIETRTTQVGSSATRPTATGRSALRAGRGTASTTPSGRTAATSSGWGGTWARTCRCTRS